MILSKNYFANILIQIPNNFEYCTYVLQFYIVEENLL